MSQQRQSHHKAKAAASAALTLALLGSLVGCSGSSPKSDKEPQTITFGIGVASTGERYFQDVAAAYEASHKGVTINIQKLPSQSYAQAIATRVQGGNAPDVFQAEAGTGTADAIQPFAKAGLLLPLTDPSFTTYLKSVGLAQYQSGGKIYAVATGSSLNGIVFNAVAAKAAGIDLTASSSFDQVLQACTTAKSKGKALLGLAGSVPQNTGLLALELAASSVYGSDPDWDAQRASGKVTFASSAGWKTALESAKKLYQGGCFQSGALGAGFDALTSGSAQGSIFGFLAPSGAAVDISNASNGKINLVALPFPAPNGEKTYASVSSDLALAGSAKTKSPKLVADFLNYVASPAGQKVLAKTSGAFPIGTTDRSSLIPEYAPSADLIVNKDYRNLPTINWPNAKVYADLGSGVQGLLTGQQTVESVLQEMDTDWG